jgi:hypothetical protein
MVFPIPDAYAATAADMVRDQTKRTASPPSFFFGQAWGIKLAAGYFTDDRLATGSRSAVATKHRQRIQNAAFGQLMASFEYCVKDFIAQVLDATDLFDQAVEQSKWIEVTKSRILSQREGRTSIGSVLIHPLLGWHDGETVNARYEALFSKPLIKADQLETLERLWILRHSVAHNAGLVTGHDAYRLRAPNLTEKQLRIDPEFLESTIWFLAGIIHRMGDPIGSGIVKRWLANKATGEWDQDREVYAALKLVGTVQESRTQDLPIIGEADYAEDVLTLE